jgi:3-oxoacyl-[acyl-carrier protein] reductase
MKDRRIALVTGAAQGIGASIAGELAMRGYDLAVNDLPAQSAVLDAVASDLAAKGGRVLPVLADVSSAADVDDMARRVLGEFRRLDVLVNNAGILDFRDVVELSEQDWDATMDVNAKGAFLTVKAFVPSMKARGYGRIVNIASIGGKHGTPAQAHYAASKAAMMGFTRVLAQEVGPFGITANCVCPGIIATEIARHKLEQPENRDYWVARTAMQRIGHPSDVVGPVAFLASDDAAFVTGQTLNVDGGIVLS